METDKPASDPACIALIGAPRLVPAGGVAQPLERKDAALLALLALDGPTSRARAASLLWPEGDDDTARNNLRQRLHRLRKRAGRELVIASHGVLHLAADVACDVPGTTHAGAGHGNGGDELLGAFTYDDCTELGEWVSGARERLRIARRDALAASAARLEREGHIAQALQIAEQLLADDPLLEHSHRRLMRLHYLRGDRAAALAAFHRCREALSRELGVAPGKETRDLAALVESSGQLPPSPQSPVPVALLRPPRLVGRQAEWHLLEQSWLERRPTLVVGEPGIGKSRLLAEFAGAHESLVVGARHGDANVPYALLARLLRALAPRCGPVRQSWARRELARLVPEFDPESTAIGDVNAVRLAEAIELLLAAAQGAPEEARSDGLRGFVVEDLQYADADSIGMLRLVARAESPALAWLFSARTHDPASLAPPWLGLAESPASRLLALQPLDAAGTLELMQSLELEEVDAAAMATHVYRHTGGNPMFVLETLSALLAIDPAKRGAVPALARRLPVPDTVGRLIEARLARLSAPALKLTRVAVLAGDDFSPELAAAVLEQHVLDLAEPWREMVQAQIVRDDGFAHDLVLEAARRSIPEALTQATHRAIARCLASRSAPAERIASHWRQARSWAQAADAYLQAAEQALALSRRAEELMLLRAAADCLVHADAAPPEAAALHFEIELRSARASLLIDRADEARRFAERALVLAPQPRQRAAALAVCAETGEFIGAFDAAIEHATEGLRLAQQLDDAPLELTHAALLGRVLATRGDFDAGRAMFDAHAGRIGAAGTASAARAFLMHHAVVLDQARRREAAVVSGMKALELAEEARDDSIACMCHMHVASFHARLGRGAEAFEHAQRAVQLRERIGHRGGQSEVAEVYLAVMLTALGRFGRTLELLDTAQRRLGQGRAVSWAMMARVVLARTWIILGQPGRGWPLLADDVLGVSDSVRGLQLVNRVRVLRALGRPRAREIAEAGALFARQAQHEGDLLVQLEQAIDATPAQGAALAAAVEAEAGERMHRALQLDAQVIGCAALLAAGATDEAARKAREALRLAEGSITWTLYRPEVWWRAHEALAAAGSGDEAQAALRQAKEWIAASLLDVPDSFRDSFMHRNPVNRAVLAAASRNPKADRR